LRKLLALIFLIFLTLSCAQPEGRVVRGGTPRGTNEGEKSPRSVERTSLREFGRDWKGRYCEKTIKKKYGLSDRQLEAAKRELRKKNLSFTTKATHSCPGSTMPQVTE